MKPLNYRSPVGDTPGTFAEWLRALRNQSGAYVFRSKETSEILYVGESHTGRLYSTITRHFHDWNQTKSLWYQVPVPRTYSRHHVEVAIRITPPGAATGAQNNLIERLRPRDNVLGQPTDEPF